MKAHCPTRYALLNATHACHAPVMSKTACLYVSGARQVTELAVDDTGFTLRVWEQCGDTARLVHYRPAERSANGLWKQLEVDVLTGHARLNDRAAVRGVGGNPKYRAQHRATDGVGAVTMWLRRAEAWFEKRVAKQRTELLRANAMLATGPDTAPIDGATNVVRLPYMPLPLGVENALDAAQNGGVYGRIAHPSQVVVGGTKHWDEDGALAVRGKRMASGSTAATMYGKRERATRLRAMATRQLAMAAESEVLGDTLLVEVYSEMAQDSETRAAKLEQELRDRAAIARAGKAAKRQLRVEATAPVAEALAGEAEHRAALAAVGKGETAEDAE